MGTMNFSVPDDVKQAFDTAFHGKNKSAILTDLMREAVARVEQEKRRAQAVERLLKRRSKAPRLTASTLNKVRKTGRP